MASLSPEGPGMKARLRADRFREMALRRNESVGDVAHGAGVDHFNLYRLLGGTRTPTATTRRKLLEHFGCSFDDLFEIAGRTDA